MKETKDEREKTNLIVKKTRKIAKKDVPIDTKKEKNVEKNPIKTTAKITKKVTSKSEKVSNISKKISSRKEKSIVKTFSEYYDLPYRYNQTVIKILAQTPHALFVYWDISDDDRREMNEKYGDRFFYETKPILLVHNKTLNSNFQIEVDDFTNSWYIRTPTSNCIFEIELGRKKITENKKINFENNSNILHITKSNTLESPNDHILKETLNTVYFKNVKTNELEKRDVSKYNVKNVYGLLNLYNDENGYENNPSSDFRIS